MKNNKLHSLICIFLLFQLSGCMGVKHGGSTTPAGKLMEEFFVQQGVMQYFIKPLEWKLMGDKGLVQTDFTFRDSAGTKTPVTCNFTLGGLRADSVQIGEGPSSFKARTTTIFEEKNDGKPRYRYSALLTPSALQQLIQGGAPFQIISSLPNNWKREKLQAYPTGKTRKRLKKLALTFF